MGSDMCGWLYHDGWHGLRLKEMCWVRQCIISFAVFRPQRIEDEEDEDEGEVPEPPCATCAKSGQPCEGLPGFVCVSCRTLKKACSRASHGKALKRKGVPSPQKSSPKKKKGMSGETVKYARDMSTLCLSTMRLLGVMLVFPEMVKLFTGTYIFIALRE